MDRRCLGTLRETSAQIFLMDTSNVGSYTTFCISCFRGSPLLSLCGLCAWSTDAVGIHGPSGPRSNCPPLSRISHYDEVEGTESDRVGKYLACRGSSTYPSLYWLYGL